MEQQRTAERMGWRPDLPDYRDEPYLFGRALAGEMVSAGNLPIRSTPQRKELNKHPINDQRMAGSCTGEGMGLVAAVERNVKQRSAVYIYAEARKIIGELHLDNGAYIRDAAKVVATGGAPMERRWPRDIDPATDKPRRLHEDPSEAADRDALKRKVFSYHKLLTGEEYQSCLASGHLFAIGYAVYTNHWDPFVDRFGILGWPEGRSEGGHCVAVIGVDNDFRNSEWAQWARNGGAPESRIPARAYEVQGSWGVEYGRGGRYMIDAAMIESRFLAGDAQTLRGFEDPNK